MSQWPGKPAADTARTRVLVVEDSATVRAHLCAVLARDPHLDVVGQAADGRQAIDLVARTRPDVITMDMVLPHVSGLAAIEHIMAHQPTPVLVVSSSTNRGELYHTYDALAAGAVDVLPKPRGDHTDTTWERRLIATVKLVSRIQVITHPRARLQGRRNNNPTASNSPPHPDATVRPGPYDIVTIGASTGGPAALVEVLSALSPGPPASILIVQHISEPFGAAFADWLADQTGHTVRHPSDGEVLRDTRGQVLLAPPGRHLQVLGGRLRLTNGPERHFCRPSVDTLFESLADEHPTTTAACLLTGMGRDGAHGLLALRRAGALTIAQDQQSSIVYGMPNEAARLNAARLILPLSRIGPTLAALAPTTTTP